MREASRQRWIQGLNPRQAAAVGLGTGESMRPETAGTGEVRSFPESPGAALVLAGAGSGKTTVLTRRVAFLMDAAPEGEGIIALTFTKDAAREMEMRLKEMLPEKRDSVGFPYIGTFHAFAFKLVRAEHGGETNWRRLGFSRCPALMDPAARLAWLADAKKSLALGDSLETLEEWVSAPHGDENFDAGPGDAGPGDAGVGEGAPYGKARDSRISPAYGEAAFPDSFLEEPGTVFPARAGKRDAGSMRSELRRRFRSHLLETGGVAFDDMVELAIRLLEGNPDVLAGIRSRIKHILVDEFQDTSRDQLELIRLLAGEARSLFLVGDDDQAIYGFRGADPGNIGAALECFPGTEIIKLETNYRSSAAIVAYANSVFGDKPAHLRKRLEAGCDRGMAPVHRAVHANGQEQARWMIGEMLRLRSEEGFAWADMAVIFRINALEPYYRSMLAHMGGGEAAMEVVLSTVHASKGLEYPVVFFVGLEDGILPFRRSRERLAPERMAEERRVFYVGVTRAQRRLYLCACRKRMLRGKFVESEASPFITGSRGPGRKPRFPGSGLAGAIRLLAGMRAWRRRKGAT